MSKSQASLDLAHQILQNSSQRPAAQQPSDLSALLRSLSLLTLGDPASFQQSEMPPGDVHRWLNQANSRQVQGVILLSLHRWLDLQAASSEELL